MKHTDHAAFPANADVVHRTVASPFGPLLLAATPSGLARVAFATEGHDVVLAQLADAFGPRVRKSLAPLDVAATQLAEYLAGGRHEFTVPLDLGLLAGFRLAVVERLAAIPYGTTTTYAQLAADAGSPRAVRAVGPAVANNPLPLVLPCHRVVRSDGTIGQYLGGAAVKRALLDLEASSG